MRPPTVGNAKLQAYALTCNTVLGRLAELRLATQNDLRLDYGLCLGHFNAALKDFLTGSAPADLPHAARILQSQLQAKVTLLESLNTDIAQIFQKVGMDLLIRTKSWSLEADLERFQVQGLELSRGLFAAFPPDNQNQFQRRCALTFQAPPGDEQLLLRAASPFGAAGAPLAFLGENRPTGAAGERPDRILVRLTQDQNLVNYLAYPFGFLHEYSAHIHARDYGNERFNDGWMLHAAAAFLEQHWELAERLGLDLDQTNIFYEHLYRLLNPIPRRACEFARQFHGWSSYEVAPDTFWDLTAGLAAFQAQGKAEESWPDQFINALEKSYWTNRKGLSQKLKGATTLRALFSRLTSP